MCQSIAEGGKRCVAHHPLTNAAASLMAHMYELPESQVKDAYSLLRRQLKNDDRKAPASWADEDIRAALMPKDEDIAIVLTPDERLTRKVENALKVSRETFTEADLLAFKALSARLDHTRALISRAAAQYSEEVGVSLASAREQFWATYNSITVPRGSMREGQVLDARTLEATKVLLREAVPVEREQTPRVTRSAVEGNKLFTEAGYDPDDGRLEVVLKGELYSFHSVPQELAKKVQEGSTGALREVLEGKDFRYGSGREAELDGYRARCGGCGQFVAQSGNHGCPRTLEGDPPPRGNKSRTRGWAKV